jgi:D-alanyl-D-alanine-carboxypeptidase/D-alanyl-D-alanine-endopeptidase
VMREFRSHDLEAFLLAHPLHMKRLGKFSYSNVGMALLGHILADCLGMDYGQAITERVLAPLGMVDTRIDWREVPTGSLVVGHDSRGRAVPPFEWEGMEPAGVWRSTLDDMITFVGAQMAAGPHDWSSLAQDMVAPRGRVGRDTTIGLGWMLSEVDRVGCIAWHTGGTVGQHAVVQWTPNASLGVVLLTNQRPPLWHHLLPSRRLEDLADRLMLDVVDGGSGEPSRA